MTRRTHTWNAWQSTITAELVSGANTVSVPLIPAEFQAPMYLVMEPAETGQKEWIKADTINGNSFENLTRNLDGSDGDLTHPINSVIRLVISKQHIDDIFLDIEDNTAAVDLKVSKSGDTMSGVLNMDDGTIDNIGTLLFNTTGSDYKLFTDTDDWYLQYGGVNRLGILNLGWFRFYDSAGAITAEAQEDTWDFKVPIDMGSTNKIISLADPTLDQDAATKKYVDDNTYTDQEAVDAVEATDTSKSLVGGVGAYNILPTDQVILMHLTGGGGGEVTLTLPDPALNPLQSVLVNQASGSIDYIRVYAGPGGAKLYFNGEIFAIQWTESGQSASFVNDGVNWYVTSSNALTVPL